jgi:hypothetical protein
VTHRILLASALIIVSLGCKQEPAEDEPDTPMCVAGDLTCVAAGTGAGASGAGGMGVAPATAMPCNVAAIVQASCWECHSATPKFGAPMSLVLATDFHAMSPREPARVLFDVAVERVTAPAMGRMPPIPMSALAEPSLTALTTWLGAGAQGATAAETAACP